jgi:Ribbon-helix-helix protein, copG family
MPEPMIRTQIYLPRAIYEELRARAQARHLTMAVQIREALEEYIWRAGQASAGSLLRPDDPLFQLAGVVDGPPDLSLNHDRYLYETAVNPISERSRQPALVKERPEATYNRSRPAKSKRSRKSR